MLHLPEDLAQEQAQKEAGQQQTARLARTIGLQVAISVYAELVGLDYQAALAAMQQEADPLGLKKDGEEVQGNLRINFSLPFKISQAASQSFLMGLGLIERTAEGEPESNGQG